MLNMPIALPWRSDDNIVEHFFGPVVGHHHNIPTPYGRRRNVGWRTSNSGSTCNFAFPWVGLKATF